MAKKAWTLRHFRISLLPFLIPCRLFWSWLSLSVLSFPQPKYGIQSLPSPRYVLQDIWSNNIYFRLVASPHHSHISTTCLRFLSISKSKPNVSRCSIDICSGLWGGGGRTGDTKHTQFTVAKNGICEESWNAPMVVNASICHAPIFWSCYNRTAVTV